LENKIIITSPPSGNLGGLRTLTASSPKGGLLCAVALHFFCHGFCKPTHMHYFVFLKDKKKNKQVQPSAPTKTHAKKRWREAK
jgi:hypothetical protein